MNKLQILGLMKSLGYEPFNPLGTYLQSTMHYTIASFQNKETDPLIYSFNNDLGQSIKIWNKVHYQGIFLFEWPEEDLFFEDNLYINSDRFIVRVNESNYSKLFNFQTMNRFSRPVIRGVDERLDLGPLVFAVSDVGILFSMYEYPSQKFVKELADGSEIADFRVQDHYLKMKLTKQVIGAYDNAFSIEAVHIFPQGSMWSPRVYDNWS